MRACRQLSPFKRTSGAFAAKIAATNQALEENEARQLSLERQLAALTSNVSDHEFSEESILQRIEAFTKPSSR